MKPFNFQIQVASVLSAALFALLVVAHSYAASAQSEHLNSLAPASGAIANIPLPKAHLPELEKFAHAFDRSEHSRLRDVAITSEVEDFKAESIWLVSNCRIETIQLSAFDPVTARPGNIQVRLYTPSRTLGLLRQVLLMPPTGGENALDLGYADSFCRNGFQTLVLERWDGDDVTSLDLNMHDAGAVRTLAAMRHAVEFINPEGSHSLAIFGTSVGAISSVLAMEYESRISSAILIVGGIGMSAIIAQSTEKTLAALRTQRMVAFGYPDIASYQSALKQHISIEPAAHLDQTKVKSVLMFMGDQDSTVPTANQLLLRDQLRAAGIQVTERHYDSNHIGTIKKTFFSLSNRQLMIDHLNRTLVPQSDK